MAKISIIVRTKNEERWISHCLKMILTLEIEEFIGMTNLLVKAYFCVEFFQKSACVPDRAKSSIL